ncbi:hypothetical protein Tco_0499387 [Tanacetum coccineum]
MLHKLYSPVLSTGSFSADTVWEVSDYVLTKDIIRFKTYEEYKDDWIYEWNKDMSWVHEKPWTDNEAWKEPISVKHYYEPFSFKNGHSEWPTYLEWYEALKDGKHKDEALKNKVILEGLINKDEESYKKAWVRWDDYENTTHNDTKGNNDDANDIGNLNYDLVRDNASYHTNEEGEQDDKDRCKLLRNPHQELPVCEIRRFEMIKYSFGPVENYVAIKECEYNDLTRTEDDACHAYK